MTEVYHPPVRYSTVGLLWKIRFLVATVNASCEPWASHASPRWAWHRGTAGDGAPLAFSARTLFPLRRGNLPV